VGVDVEQAFIKNSVNKPSKYFFIESTSAYYTIGFGSYTPPPL
jgi:hypothetical protein